MPPSTDASSSQTAARLLRGAALLFVVLGTGLIAWVVDKWMQHPEVQASQFGFEAPFWPALILFVLVAMTAVVALLWRAAIRVDQGENLFAQRHRRRRRDARTRDSPPEKEPRPSDPPEQNDLPASSD